MVCRVASAGVLRAGELAAFSGSEAARGGSATAATASCEGVALWYARWLRADERLLTGLGGLAATTLGERG